MIYSARECVLSGLISRPLLRSAVALALALAVSRSASALDLMQAYDLARGRDATLRSAEATYRANLEALPQAQAALGPSVSLTAGGSLIRAQVTGAAPATGVSTQGALSGTLPLYHPAEHIGVTSAELRVPGYEAQRSQAQQDLVVRVAQAYLSALLAQDTLNSAHKQQEAVQAQLAQAKRMFEIGTGTVTDVNDAQARADLMVVTELQVRNSLLIATQALEGLTGVSPIGEMAPVHAFDDATPPWEHDMQRWADLAVKQNPAVVQADANARAQRNEIDRARAAWLPTLDLTAGLVAQRYSQNDLNLTGSGGRSAEIGINFSWQIWEAGLRDAHLRQATAQAEQADAEFELSRGRASLQARQAYVSLQTTSAQVSAYQQAVHSSEVSLEGTTQGNLVGTRTVVDVLNASQQLFQARTQLVGARYSALLGWLQLKAAAAQVTQADLTAIAGP